MLFEFFKFIVLCAAIGLFVLFAFLMVASGDWIDAIVVTIAGLVTIPSITEALYGEA